jgi:PilZ domain
MGAFMRDRRTSPRIIVNLPTVWEGATMLQEGNLTSLSKTGCFVLTAGRVEPKELVRLEINISEDEPLCLWGEVVDEAGEIGFALRFNPLDNSEHERLGRFVDKVLAESESKLL